MCRDFLSRTGGHARPPAILGATGVLTRHPSDLVRVQSRQWHRHMLVDCLALVVVFRMRLAIWSCDRLSGFVGLESKITHLVIVGLLFVAQTLVAKHQVVMGLEIF